MKNQPILRDERTVAVENASFRLAYYILSYGLLLSVAYRGFVLEQSSWDLLGLVIVAGATATYYQSRQDILERRWLLATVAAVALAALVAAALVFTIFAR